MSALMAETAQGWRVTCEQHGLDRTVATERHATNLLNLHQRKDHADDTQIVSVDLTSAAQALLEEIPYAGQGTALEGALDVWCALTGMTEDEVTAYARELADSTPPITAHIAPF